MEERRYSYKPRPKFFGEGVAFLGLELEVEAPDDERKRAGLNVERAPSWCYAKHDGSLGVHGWELVTHPISLSSWMSRNEVRDYHDIREGTTLMGRYKGQTYTAVVLAGRKVEWNGTTYSSISAAGSAIRGGKATNGYQFFGLTGGATVRNDPTRAFFRLVKSLKELGYDSHDGGRCGFHVHVSRKAFAANGQLNSAMFFRFKSLINGVLFRKLSQRDEFRYCQQEPVDRYNYTYRGNRYSAVNITDQTVEVRIFRGNLREDRLRKNIEAVIAAIEFARDTQFSYDTVTANFTTPTDAEFIAYVRERRDRFPNLVAYIAAKGLANETTATEGGD